MIRETQTQIQTPKATKSEANQGYHNSARFLLGMPFAQLGVGVDMEEKQKQKPKSKEESHTQRHIHLLAPISMPISHLRGRIYET